MRIKPIPLAVIFLLLTVPFFVEKIEAKGHELVVLASADDPYYPLAEEIAERLSVPVVHSLNKIAKLHPDMVVYVVSPNALSERKLISFGRYFKESGHFPALGIITGTTMKIARELWERGFQGIQGTYYLASDTDRNLGLASGVIFRIDGDAVEENPLTKDNLIAALKTARSLYWARHVSKSRWTWHNVEDPDDYDSLYASDIPELGPVLIHTPSCDSMYPWKKNSIALGFIDKGAAAYAGHLYSPINQFIFIGHMQYLPALHTWDEFPFGILVQVQNRATAKAIASIPFFFLLGNPRITLSDKKPYTITTDRIEDGKRIIIGESDVEGVLPVRIKNGAIFSFVQIAGLTSVGYDDPFYNTMLQTLNLGQDKYLLFLHQGGDFRIELTEQAPFLHHVFDPLIDSLDFSWITIGVCNNIFSLVFVILFLIIAIFKLFKKKPVRRYIPALFAGFSFAVLYIGYIIFRDDYVSVSSYPHHISSIDLLLGFVGTFSAVSAGYIVMLDAKRWFTWGFGVILGVLPHVLLTGFFAGVIFVTNLLFYKQHPERIFLWNDTLVLMACTVLVMEVALLLTLFFLGKIITK